MWTAVEISLLAAYSFSPVYSGPNDIIIFVCVCLSASVRACERYIDNAIVLWWEGEIVIALDWFWFMKTSCLRRFWTGLGTGGKLMRPSTNINIVTGQFKPMFARLAHGARCMVSSRWLTARQVINRDWRRSVVQWVRAGAFWPRSPMLEGQASIPGGVSSLTWHDFLTDCRR